MNGYYNRYPQDGEGVMEELTDGTSGATTGAQSLDDIVNENSKVMRRRSVALPYGNSHMGMTEQDMRRISMMEFNGHHPGGPLESYTFNHTGGSSIEDMMQAGEQLDNGMQVNLGKSAHNLLLNTQFSNQNTPYGTMASPATAYTSPLPPNTNMDIEMASPYLATNLNMSMDMNDLGLGNMANSDYPNSNIYNQHSFGSPIGSPIDMDFSASTSAMAQPAQISSLENQPLSSASATPHQSTTHQSTPNQSTPSQSTPLDNTSHHRSQSQGVQTNSMQQRPAASTHSSSGQVSHSQQESNDVPPESPRTSAQFNQMKFPWTEPPGGFPSTMHGRPHVEGQFKNAYSQSGFDMLKVLMRVASRPNPEINIGSVDLSCAFVACDAEMDDNPIIYCSENFERLTGYDKHMILGRNCRFLQSPDGKVKAGQKRQFCDDDSILYLKNCVNMRREAQISIINYRRGGQPFMNLLTMIPIPWDSDSIKYIVGFQVDLVEQPNAVINRNADGTYAMNYQRGITMPRYIAPGEKLPHELAGQTISRDEVSSILTSFGTAGDSEFTKRVWDKVLLENTDDVVHVLSLKGLFLYLSPSSKKVLEYDPNELVGTALSSICHPSDIVPVTRELKDTSGSVSVNVVFRIRRKHSGYMWWEGHGSLHTEQGKGRKCIILVGRERPVHSLNKTDIVESGGIGDNELWTKMSTTGMFLFVSSNVRQLLDRHPDELLGTSIQALMRHDSKQEFGRILMIAYTGKRASVKHEMMNRRGQILQAFTTLYPGDAIEGQKPTFLIAQTRMLKFSRGSTQPAQRAFLGAADSTTGASTPMSHITSTNGGQSVGRSTPLSGISGSKFQSTEGMPFTYSGQNGLPLGKQDINLASEENLFEELKTVRSTSWQFELRQMEKRNRFLAEEVQSLLAAKKKRKRRKGAGQLQKDCANCHTRVTPEWRRGPSGNRDLCNSCGLRWAKQNGRVSPRTSSQPSVSGQSDKASKASASPNHDPTKSYQVSSMETAQAIQSGDGHTSQGHAVAVPPKIEEGIEPD